MFDKVIPDDVLQVHINTINAVKCIYGLDIECYEVTDENVAAQVMKLLEKLEEHDDVQNVYANFDISDEILQKIEG